MPSEMKTESELTRDLCRRIVDRGWMIQTIVGGQSAGSTRAGKRKVMQAPGWPDRILCAPQGTWWLEMKAHNGKLSLIQRQIIKKLNFVQPGSAFVVRFHSEGEILDVEDADGNVLAIADGHDPDCLAQALCRATDLMPLRSGDVRAHK